MTVSPPPLGARVSKPHASGVGRLLLHSNHMPHLFAQMAPPEPTFRFRDFRPERRGFISVFTFDDGRRRWDILERGHAVAVLPVDWRRREAYLVEQPRYVLAFANAEAIDKLNDPTAEVAGATADLMSLETPSGIIDQDEDPVAAAIRETREETGFSVTAGQLTEIGCYFGSVGVLPETTRCYLASLPDDGPTDGPTAAPPEGDGEEYITVWRYSFDELFAALDAGRFRTPSAIILIQELRHRAAQQPSARS